jgi:hypothetical protein
MRKGHTHRKRWRKPNIQTKSNQRADDRPFETDEKDITEDAGEGGSPECMGGGKERRRRDVDECGNSGAKSRYRGGTCLLRVVLNYGQSVASPTGALQVAH